MPAEYMKLVRDRIPEIIQSEGRTCQVEVMPLEDYRQALLAKVVEEASEVASAPREKLATEIADLWEVLDALMTAFELDPEDVRTLQAQRREERGGFEKRLKLLRTE